MHHHQIERPPPRRERLPSSPRFPEGDAPFQMCALRYRFSTRLGVGGGLPKADSPESAVALRPADNAAPVLREMSSGSGHVTTWEAGRERYVTHAVTRDRLLLETKVSNGEKVPAIRQISGADGAWRGLGKGRVVEEVEEVNSGMIG